MIVREERAGETGVVGEVVEAAFGSASGVHLLLGDLRCSVAWLGVSFVAVDGDEVVGHVAHSRAWVDDPRRLIEVLVLSPMSVRPDRQRPRLTAYDAEMRGALVYPDVWWRHDAVGLRP